MTEAEMAKASAVGERVCRRCRATIRPVPIVYGMPGAELWAEAEAGRVRLGGCVVEPESPDFACPACDAPLPWVDPARLERERRLRLH